MRKLIPPMALVLVLLMAGCLGPMTPKQQAGARRTEFNAVLESCLVLRQQGKIDDEQYGHLTKFFDAGLQLLDQMDAAAERGETLTLDIHIATFQRVLDSLILTRNVIEKAAAKPEVDDG